MKNYYTEASLGVKKRKATLLAASGLLLSSIGVYANINNAIRAYQVEGENQAVLTPKTQIDSLKASSIQNQSENKNLIATIMQSAKSHLQTEQKPQGAEGAVLFVSFSMPDALLFALADEAAHFNIPVVINGLVDGDFKKTIETFKRLNLEAKKQPLNFKGLSIDPIWFSQFQIKSVPALVVTERSKQCASKDDCINQPFDVVYGNASISKALELIVKKGDSGAQQAKAILESWHA